MFYFTCDRSLRHATLYANDPKTFLQQRKNVLSKQFAQLFRRLMPNTHRQRRRNSTYSSDELSRVGGVLNSQIVHDGFGRKIES